MKDLMKLAKECMSELDAIGVKYGNVVEWKVNTRAKSRWGRCSKRYDGFHIEITNELLYDHLSDKGAKNTIFHELLHSVEGCMNHGTKWQSLADLVNDCYGYSIQRCSSSDEGDKKGAILERKVEYKYVLKCANCGQIVRRQRMSDFVKNYKDYGCGKCGRWHTFEMV